VIWCSVWNDIVNIKVSNLNAGQRPSTTEDALIIRLD
jgi:hypothetical protein